MRIAMIAACPLPWPRGTPIRIHRIAEALTRRGHRVDIVTYALGDPRVEVPYDIHRIGSVGAGYDGRPGPTLRKLLLYDPLLIYRLARLLRSAEFDVIHAHHYEGLLVALCAGRLAPATPLVYDAHTLLESELPHYRFGLPRGFVRRLGRTLDRRLPPLADHVIAVSEDMRVSLLEDRRLGPDRVTLIPNGIEVEHFAGAASVAGRPASPSKIVYSGNLAEYQGIDLLLRAFAMLLEWRTDARLLLLTEASFDGFAPLARQLRIAHAIDVEPVDYANLPERLASADVLVNPRIACGGIPQKLLNYMASGRPIVSFAGSAKLLEHGHTALLVDDGDVGGFARAICRVLDERALGQVLADNARKLVLSEHGWTQVGERVEAVYRRLTEHE